MIQISRTAESIAGPLLAKKAEANDKIVSITSEVRQQFVTPIIGQELTYQEKERQAITFVAEAVEPDPDDPADQDAFGFIFGEVGVTAPTPQQVAQVILNKAAGMRYYGPMIERLRLTVMSNIESSTTEAEADQALSDYIEDLGEFM